METGQGTTNQAKGINNSTRGAALCLGVKAETIAKFLPLMRSYENQDAESVSYEFLAEENNRLNKMLTSFNVENNYLLQRIEELANTVTKQNEEIIKLYKDVQKAQGK